MGLVDSETEIYKPNHFKTAASFFFFSKMIDAIVPKRGLRAIATMSDVAILMLNRGMTQSQFMNACIAHAFFCAFFGLDYDHVDAPTRSWKFLNWSYKTEDENKRQRPVDDSGEVQEQDGGADTSVIIVDE